jgi:hypothetical protein
MNNTIPIEDFIYTRESTVNNIQIRVMNVELYKSVSVYVMLFSDKTVVDTKNFLLTGDDYTSWGNDDDYIVNYVLTKLNLTKLPASAVVTTE